MGITLRYACENFDTQLFPQGMYAAVASIRKGKDNLIKSAVQDIHICPDEIGGRDNS
jgi:hypothetical protein